MPKDIEESC